MGMTKDRLFSISILLFCLALYAATFNFAEASGSRVGPQVYPRAILVVVASLAAISLVLTFVHKSSEKLRYRGFFRNYGKIVTLFIFFFFYALLLPILGFIPATLIFMFGGQAVLMGLRKPKAIATNITVTVVATFAVYFIFTEALNILLP